MSRPLPDPLWTRRAAVLFDLDGVLLDSMPAHADAWIAALRELNVSVSSEEIYAREGEPGARSLAFFLARGGLDPTPELVRQVLASKESRFRSGPHPSLFPGARELLEELARRRKRLAIVTGTSAEEVRTILPDDLLGLFEVIMTGDQVKHGKPDPEPYQRTLQAMCLLPQDAIVIENAPLGLRSAKAAGITCLVVETSNRCPQLAEADGCFPDLHALSSFFLA